MMRLAAKDIEKHSSNTGEVDCLLWKGVKFSWETTINNVDQYSVEGNFVLLPGKKLYEKLIISADFINNVFYLKTGRGNSVTWIKLLDF